MGKWRDRLGGEHEGSSQEMLGWAGKELSEYIWMHTGGHGAWSLLTRAGGVNGFDPTGDGAKFAPPPEAPMMGATPYFFTAADDLWAWDVQPRWVLRKILDPRKAHAGASSAQRPIALACDAGTTGGVEPWRDVSLTLPSDSAPRRALANTPSDVEEE